MPEISRRGAKMPASPIRKLVPYAEQAAAEGTKIYKLNIGQPDIPTPKEFMNAVRNYNAPVLEYSHSAGNESYRTKLAHHYEKSGIENITKNDLMITTGGSEALLFVMMSCLNHNDDIIIPEPFYANYNAFALTAGVNVVPITSNISNGFALPPIADFEKKITPRTKAILICNPGNPTGYLYTNAELEALRLLVTKHNLFLIADEVYREFCYENHTHTSILSLQGIDQHAVVIDSISKRYSACGARIGTLISKNTDLMQTALKYAQARLSPPTFEQIGAEAALQVPQEYFEKVKTEYIARRNLVVTALNKMDGVICPTPQGAFYCMVQLPIDDSDKFCRWMLEKFSYKSQTVMMAPATGFYATKKLGKKQVRIAYVLNQADLAAAMETLQEGLIVYNDKVMKYKK
jgi:aspartate aminotransferase